MYHMEMAFDVFDYGCNGVQNYSIHLHTSCRHNAEFIYMIWFC